MEEKNNLLSPEDFQRRLDEYKDYWYKSLIYTGVVHKVCSLRRAAKRGRLSINGLVHRPFNNRKNTCKRGHSSHQLMDLRRKAYARHKQLEAAKDN